MVVSILLAFVVIQKWEINKKTINQSNGIYTFIYKNI